MRSIELFSGAGGLALGVHNAGFHHVAIAEIDHDSCDTLRFNGEKMRWPVHECDVRQFDYRRYEQTIELLAAGAPCQPFSLGGKHAGDADHRNMFPEVFRAVRELRPDAFILENVRGLTRESFRPYFDYILEHLQSPGIVPKPREDWISHRARLVEYHSEYDVKFQILNAADFGVPQWRERVVIVGLRKDLERGWSFPFPTHSKDALLYAQYVDGSYWEEHGIQPRAVPARFSRRVKKLFTKPKPMEQRWLTVRDAIGDLPDPDCRGLTPPISNHVQVPGARAYKGHTGSPWDWPAKALKAGDHGNPGGENMLRNDDETVRYFTVRELARLQTFPDHWVFSGSWSENRRQLGNAVPVRLAEIIASGMMRILIDADRATESGQRQRQSVAQVSVS